MRVESVAASVADNHTYDVVVIGTGAAGLCAALSASARGSRVLVLEKSNLVGGTSAMSGGGVWIPCNHYQAGVGSHDSREEALEYIRAVAPQGWHNVEEPLWVAFVDHAPEMLRFVEKVSPLRFAPCLEPDPYVESPGGKRFGRMVSPRPISALSLGSWRRRIRGPMFSPWINYHEIHENNFYAQSTRALLRLAPKIVYRMVTAKRVMGNALMVGLLRGCLERGCAVWTDAPARRLCRRDGRVDGVELERGGVPMTVRARKGVVLASGGFEWNAQMMAEHFPGPVEWTGSPTTNTGDGQRMAAEIGAMLDRMDQALLYGTTATPYEGGVRGVPAGDYCMPHSMVVNRHGQRFMNEKAMNFGLAFNERDPDSGAPLHLPAWRIYDSQFASKYPLALPKTNKFATRFVDRTLRGLAGQIGVVPAGLEETAARFSGFARAGRDDDFGRGETFWDRQRMADPNNEPNPTLGSIEVPPFYAYPFKASFLGTKGGARTNERGQVIDREGAVIHGLYAAGNVMANPFGTKAVGAGTTLGPCLTWGYICGLNAHQNRH
jgi:3-oxosteroid 1-dehydrogenase